MQTDLSLQAAWEASQRGAAGIIDLRSPGDFATGHPRGALSLPYSRQGLAERLAAVLEAGSTAIPLADEADRGAAISQLEAGGYVVLGSIPSFAAWRAAGLPVDRVVAITVESLGGAANGHQHTIIDVREPMEWETGHVPGALLIPLGRLPREIPSLAVDARVAVICEAGIRSSTAASLLKRAGFGDVSNVLEGTAGYRRAGLPLAFTVGQ